MRVVLSIILIISLPQFAFADRLKDLTDVQGVRSNQLIGYGLVVGLDGTGDKTNQTPFTAQTFRNMMEQFGISVPENLTPKLKNVAAVSIHSELPPFAKPGQRIDVTVSSLGNASSLRGGTLLMTPLRGADGKVYGLAQGDLVVGGFGAQGADGSKITVNVPSVGRIPNGASVEAAAPNPFNQGDTLTFNLRQADFTTAKRVRDEINRLLGPGVARSIDATSIVVTAPRDPSQRVTYLSVLENLEIKPAEPSAKVIINSRTGTIVIGNNVKVSPAAVTHGNLTVTITEGVEVTQPNALAGGRTVAANESQIDVSQEKSHMFKVGDSVTLDDIVAAVNRVGMAPGDLMAILEALKQAGALRAELIVI
ncbi:flagellar basal body P-ring protein FlgI [Ketobacter alkanivorans]|uniref:Flagellar P-ring protein n=1 Tax=Ketobacter alkanivorans TaxID=1917421 RepID=A0A2K9LHD7_9GAMM|nr:flagellar basal body P-ring protein FlgI [Ketobacter alkanivorans]AUM11647.1 flagellar biosynthesis protein FlgI [Ketobacter alkanivorans]MCP5015273.1 flagellar basal body P-ring protein FlgI [Ketobacter sp.]